MEELIAKYAKVPLQHRLLAFLGVVIAVISVFYFLIYDAQATSITRLQSQLGKLESEQAEKQAYIENLAKHEARLVELEQSLTVARSQLPDDPDVPQLLAQLGNKARQAGLVIDRFEPKGETVSDIYAEIVFDMKVRGSYHEIASFVDSLSKLDRIINVAGITMSSPKTQNQKVVVEGAFTIKTYRSISAAELMEMETTKQAKGKGKKTKGKGK